MAKLKKIFSVGICVILCLSILPTNSVEAASKATYAMQTKKVTWKDEDNIVRGIVSFQYPKLKGNSKGIAKINKVLQNAMKEYMVHENVERILTSGKAYISFGSYELNLGTSWKIFSVTSRYK